MDTLLGLRPASAPYDHDQASSAINCWSPGYRTDRFARVLFVHGKSSQIINFI
jgi:hypothetical protein